MTAPSDESSRPVAGPPRAEPTDAQHDWILLHFNVDMRAATASPSGAAPPGSGAPAPSGAAPGAAAAPAAAAPPPDAGHPSIEHQQAWAGKAADGAPAQPKPNRNLSPGRHTVTVAVDRARFPGRSIPGVELVKLFIMQEEGVSVAEAAHLLKAEKWSGIPGQYVIAKGSRVAFTYVVVPGQKFGEAAKAAPAGPPPAPAAHAGQAERVMQAIGLAAGKLGGAAGAKLQELATPANAAIMIGFIGVYVAAQATPVGWVADGLTLASLLVGAYMMKADLEQVIADVKAFISITADPNGSLDDAAAHLARAAAAVGVDALLMILMHKAGAAAKPYLKPPAGFVDVATAKGIVRVPADAVPKGVPPEGGNATGTDPGPPPAADAPPPKPVDTSPPPDPPPDPQPPRKLAEGAEPPPKPQRPTQETAEPAGEGAIDPVAREFTAKLLAEPKSLVGKSAADIAGIYERAGYKVSVEQSTKGSKRSTQIRISGNPDVGNIQVHPGGGRHGGAYYKVSTSKQGIIKLVDPATYQAEPGEKARIIEVPGLEGTMPR